MFVSKRFLLVSALVLTALLFASASSSLAAAQWEPIGPDGGDRFEVRISPLDNQLLFVYGGRGIHRSTNAGTTWTSVSTPDMIQFNSILAMEFDTVDPQTMYLGGAARGVWKSDDSGVTWTQHSNGIPPRAVNLNVYASIYSLVFDSSGTLYAGSADPALSSDPAAAWIYKSMDGGDNWEAADSGISVTAPVLSQTPSVLLSKDVDGQVWAMVYGGGVFRLEQGDWVSHNGDLPQSGLLGTYLAHHPTQAGRLFLGTEDDWVFESADFGATWTPMVLPDELASLSVLPLVYFVGIDPNNPDIVIIRANDNYGSNEQSLFRPRPDQTEGRGLYYTFDAGATWFRRSAFIFRMTFDPSETIEDLIPGVGVVKRTKVSYATSAGRMCVQKSIDGQITFTTTIDGIDNLLINAVFVHSNPPAPYDAIVYSGAEGGLFVTDGVEPLAWKQQKSVEDTLYTWSFAENFDDPNKVFYSTGNPSWNFPEQRGVYEADISCLIDPETVCAPGQQLLTGVGVWKIVTTPTDPLKVYALCQEDGIMVSSDGGQTWDPFNDGLTLPASITDIVLAADGTPLYASSRRSDGEAGDDNGDSWTPTRRETGAIYAYDTGLAQWVKIPGVDLAVMALDFDAAANVHFAATVQGIYRTDDDWATWEQHEWTKTFTDVLVDPTRDNAIYASSYDGVFRAVDGGSAWQDISDGLETYEVNQLAMDFSTGELYAATSGSSVCRLLPDFVPQPEIVFDIGGIDFGSLPVGFMRQASFTITNVGEADLVVDGIVPDHADLTVLDSFPQTIGAFTTSVVTVQFDPTAPQMVNANLVITSNDPASPTIYFPATGEATAAIEPVPDLKLDTLDGPMSINPGTPVLITASLTAGDYLGQSAELWISVDTPMGLYWLAEGSGWVRSDLPLAFVSNGVIVAIEFPINMGSALPRGSYSFQFSVDNIVNGALDPVWFDVLDLDIVPAVDPTPDIKMNGQDGPLTLAFGTDATLTVGLSAGDYRGDSAEYWLSVQTPVGLYWYVVGSGWTQSATPVRCTTASVLDFNTPVSLGSGLPGGSYQFEFTVDNVVNGALDSVWTDTLSMSVQ